MAADIGRPTAGLDGLFSPRWMPPAVPLRRRPSAAARSASACSTPSRRARRAAVRPVRVSPMPAARALRGVRLGVAESAAQIPDLDLVVGVTHLGERRAARGMDGHDSGQRGELGHAAHAGRLGRDHERERAAPLAQLLAGAEQHRQHRRVDERALGQVDDHGALHSGPCEHIGERGPAAEIVLPPQLDDGHAEPVEADADALLRGARLPCLPDSCPPAVHDDFPGLCSTDPRLTSRSRGSR